MKATGIIRKIDELGRVVIPIELRRALDIGERDALEIYTDSDKIILAKHQSVCVFCGKARDVRPFKGKYVCPDCIRELSK